MGHDLGYAALALLSTSAYYVAFLVFRLAAARMPPLRGSRPFHVAWHMITDPVWFSGGLILFLGLAYQVVAFTAMPLAVAQPIFALSLVLLVVYAVWFLGERLNAREWFSVALFVLATILIGLSAGSEGPLTAETSLLDTLKAPWLMLAVMAPALIVAALVWLVGDRRAGGRHARKLAGVAYGIGAGACAGLGEAGIRGISLVYEDTGSVVSVLASPYPYLTLGMAGLALLQLQIALQRCRVAIVATVLTVIGRAYLVLSSVVLFGEEWPRESGSFALRAAGFTLALIALAVFPRYERPAAAEAAAVQSASALPRRSTA
ncbi:DMT family transporter [Spirillospora sp. NPDC029432]|uniref:DMT family transporter n=1 Tax=Spirillospora sp. NPDC029432 TaxID=3154599 RepID=UPI003456EAA3